MELVTGENDKDRRLDRILRKALPRHPLPLIHRLLRQGLVFVNGKPAKAQDRVCGGVKISIPSLNDAPKNAPGTASLPPPAVIWEGPGLIAVNKPAGLAVHGPAVCAEGGSSCPYSLDEMVRSFLAGKTSPSLSFKPGPLHRLDKPSSGVVVFSTNIEGARLFSALMRERRVKKTYLAVVEGNVKKEDLWEDALVRDREMKKTFVSSNGKNAVTTIKPLASRSAYSLVSAQIDTGRTHQIRAQAAAHGHPLMGDKKYGGQGKGGLFLHAWKLEFLEYSIEAPPPDAFKKKVLELFDIKI